VKVCVCECVCERERVRPVFWERLSDTNGKGFLQRTNFKMERQRGYSKSLDVTLTKKKINSANAFVSLT